MEENIQVISGLLLNAFYSAQLLHVSQGKTLNDQERAILLQDVLDEWTKMQKILVGLEDLRKNISQSSPG